MKKSIGLVVCIMFSLLVVGCPNGSDAIEQKAPSWSIGVWYEYDAEAEEHDLGAVIEISEDGFRFSYGRRLDGQETYNDKVIFGVPITGYDLVHKIEVSNDSELTVREQDEKHAATFRIIKQDGEWKFYQQTFDPASIEEGTYRCIVRKRNS